MPDCVIDATVIAMANGDIAGRRTGNALDRRLTVIEQVGRGARRLRYNSKLQREYGRIVQQYRNDAVELFFIVLADRSVFVARSTLSRQHHATATQKCKWPSHDQHLLAAALDGVDPTIFVTEPFHVQCAASVLAHFKIHVADLG
jgi:hypothetical protein